MLAAMATADVVETHADAAGRDAPPLLVRRALTAFLDRRGLGTGQLEASPLGDGHSNVTFLVERADRRLVLRRPPRPPYSPSAHDVLREARVLRGLEPTDVPVPRVLATCADPGVIGAPFYVMEHVEGVAVGAQAPPGLDAPGERRRIALELVDALARIHAVDLRATGLDGIGKPSGYLERQLRRFGDLWEHNRTRDVPGMAAVTAWLGRRVPDSPPSTLVHGDFRLGNALYAPEPPARVRAILDWEMATVGDPLADVGYLAATYARPGEPPTPMADLSTATAAAGFPDRDELWERYEERTGRRTGNRRWYQVLALWKAAIFLESSYARFLAGTTDDPFYGGLDSGVPRLVEAARALTGEKKEEGAAWGRVRTARS